MFLQGFILNKLITQRYPSPCITEHYVQWTGTIDRPINNEHAVCKQLTHQIIECSLHQRWEWAAIAVCQKICRKQNWLLLSGRSCKFNTITTVLRKHHCYVLCQLNWFLLKCSFGSNRNKTNVSCCVPISMDKTWTKDLWQ